jgi:hypothetical protein
VFESVTTTATETDPNNTSFEKRYFKCLQDVASPFESQLVSGMSIEKMITMPILSRIVRHKLKCQSKPVYNNEHAGRTFKPIALLMKSKDSSQQFDSLLKVLKATKKIYQRIQAIKNKGENHVQMIIHSPKNQQDLSQTMGTIDDLESMDRSPETAISGREPRFPINLVVNGKAIEDLSTLRQSGRNNTAAGNKRRSS